MWLGAFSGRRCRRAGLLGWPLQLAGPVTNCHTAHTRSTVRAVEGGRWRGNCCSQAASVCSTGEMCLSDLARIRTAPPTRPASQCVAARPWARTGSLVSVLVSLLRRRSLGLLLGRAGHSSDQKQRHPCRRARAETRTGSAAVAVAGSGGGLLSLASLAAAAAGFSDVSRGQRAVVSS